MRNIGFLSAKIFLLAYFWIIGKIDATVNPARAETTSMVRWLGLSGSDLLAWPKSFGTANFRASSHHMVESSA
jgi:hypothetical protein